MTAENHGDEFDGRSPPPGATPEQATAWIFAQLREGSACCSRHETDLVLREACAKLVAKFKPAWPVGYEASTEHRTQFFTAEEIERAIRGRGRSSR